MALTAGGGFGMKVRWSDVEPVWAGRPRGRLWMLVGVAVVIARQVLVAEEAAADAVADLRDVGAQPQEY